MKIRIDISLLISLFFAFLGFLEANWLGLIAGFLLSNLALLFLIVAIIPFIGLFLWIILFAFFRNLIFNFLPLYITSKGIFIYGLILASIVNIISTILTILFLWILFKKKAMFKAKIDVKDFINTLKKINIGDLKTFIDNLLEEFAKFWEKMDKKFIGSILFWLGLGINIHDFLWETSEEKVNPERSTHGFWIGLQIMMFGMDIITSDLSFPEKIKKLLNFYLGVGISSLGFYLLKFLPKNISRIITHFLYWSGIALMIYTWYLIEDKIYFGEKGNAC